jgi:hypothetical protein
VAVHQWLAISFCACGAFRLSCRERWVKPHGAPLWEFTAGEAARIVFLAKTLALRVRVSRIGR